MDTQRGNFPPEEMRHGQARSLSQSCFFFGIAPTKTAQSIAKHLCHMPHGWLQYATPVKNILFLARLEFLCKTGCVPHYFQYKRGHILIFPQNLSLKFLIIRFLASVAYSVLLYPSFFFFSSRHFHFPAQLLGGFTLSDLLDKPWSQVSSLLPPPYVPSIFIAHRVHYSHCSSIFIECC